MFRLVGEVHKINHAFILASMCKLYNWRNIMNYLLSISEHIAS